jgi:amino acid adenylation domain-containing protein
MNENNKTKKNQLLEDVQFHKLTYTLPDPRQNLADKWHGSIVEHFVANAKNTPDAICLVGETDRWSYGEVDLYTNQMARTLKQKSVCKGSVVLIIGKRTPALSLALLSVIRAGGAFLIFDPKYPAERLQQYIDYAKPVGVINLVQNFAYRHDLFEKAENKSQIFWIDLYNPIHVADNTPQDDLAGEPLHVPVRPNDLLYIAFTSGTTGIPKAIWGPHSPVSHFFFVQTNKFKISAQDRVSVLSGLAHDPLLRDVLMPLWVGASSWYPSDEAFEYPGRLLKWIQQSEITIMHLTPSLGKFILQIPNKQSFTACNNLRYMFFGGEILSANLVERTKSLTPHAQVVNCYGATETPQVVGWHAYRDNETSQDNGAVSIGKGIEDCQLLILNKSASLCHIGEIGEIFIRTHYLPIKVEHITGENTKSFIVNPYTNQPNDMMYATGDYGKYLPDGTVVFHGRKDRQIKIRGFRVDLSEVESAICKSAEIDAFDLIVDQNHNDVRLHLFVAVREASVDQAENIRRELSVHLPAFMIPDRISILTELPMTPNGKVDRQRLLDMADQKKTYEVADGFVMETIESRLLNIFKKSLNHRVISSETDLSKCGIDSLKTIELACLIAQEFDIEISISQLMSCKNIAGIAALIEANIVVSNGLYEHQKPTTKTETDFESSFPPDQSVSSAEDRPSYLLSKKAHLIPGNEPFIKGVCNRFLQLLARIAPEVWRVKFHKWRGVRIGENASIGYDTILETAYPYLVQIGNNVNIGMRVTVIGHFRGMTNSSSGAPTVKIGDYAFIGPGVIILPNTEIGEGAVVAAGSVVTTSVPPMTMVQGNPAKPVALCGVPLSGRATYSEFIKNLKPL